jgi:hypothetical protein
MTNRTQETSKAPEASIEEEFGQEERDKMQQALAQLDARIDLEESARYCQAIRRRRVIQSARDLLRLAMVYALTDLSLRMVGLWGTVMEWGSLSKSGIRKRLRQSRVWLGVLIGSVLLWGKVAVPGKTQYRYRLIDVSNISQPGSHKTNWRLHLDFGLSGHGIQGVQLTDASVGESLTHWEFEPDDIVLADRIYGVCRSLGVLLGALAFFVIRIGWQNLPLLDCEGRPFSICGWLGVQSLDPAATPAQVKVWVNTPQGCYPIRLIARAIPPAKAEKIRKNLRAEAKRKKRRLDERSLLAAGFVMVVSNLPESAWTAADILALYRFRWQIELVFKRLKSLLFFDHLRASDPQLAQVYLLTKILIALLLGMAQWRLSLPTSDASNVPDRPLSQWRLSQLLLQAFRQAVCGNLSWEKIINHLPSLERYLCDEPRRRQRQMASLRNREGLCCF